MILGAYDLFLIDTECHYVYLFILNGDNHSAAFGGCPLLLEHHEGQANCEFLLSEHSHSQDWAEAGVESAGEHRSLEKGDERL
jgi:hypothetical protein